MFLKLPLTVRALPPTSTPKAAAPFPGRPSDVSRQESFPSCSPGDTGIGPLARGCPYVASPSPQTPLGTEAEGLEQRKPRSPQNASPPATEGTGPRWHHRGSTRAGTARRRPSRGRVGQPAPPAHLKHVLVQNPRAEHNDAVSVYQGVVTAVQELGGLLFTVQDQGDILLVDAERNSMPPAKRQTAACDTEPQRRRLGTRGRALPAPSQG